MPAREESRTATPAAFRKPNVPNDRADGAVFSPRVVSGLAGLTDGVIVLITGLVVYVGYVGWSGSTISTYAVATGINLLLTVSGFQFAGLYKFNAIADPYRQIPKILGICTTVFLLLVAMAFAIKVSADFSRVWSFSSFVVEAILICAARVYFHRLIMAWARAGRLTRRVAVFGAGGQGQKLADLLGKGEQPWVRVVGVFDDRTDRVPSDIGGFPVRGDSRDLLEFARRERVDDIVVALPWAAEERLSEIVAKLGILPAHIMLSPDMIGLKFRHRDYQRMGGVSYLSIFEKPISDWSNILKAIEDKILAVMLLVLLAPLMAAIAAAVRLNTPGPALFRQKRYGFNNEVIEVLKFRTMQHAPDTDGRVPQARPNDPRTTAVGRFLRRTSLDELPQLFNVLGGSMSLVGPRPHAVEHNREFGALIQNYFARHRVKPGITGWAQVNGSRGATETEAKMKERVDFDVYYIENWSILLDLKILVMTAFVVLGQKNAY